MPPRNALALRKDAGLSLREMEEAVAEKTGVRVDHSSIQRLEQGGMIRERGLWAIAAFFDITIDKLLSPVEPNGARPREPT